MPKVEIWEMEPEEELVLEIDETDDDSFFCCIVTGGGADPKPVKKD